MAHKSGRWFSALLFVLTPLRFFLLPLPVQAQGEGGLGALGGPLGFLLFLFLILSQLLGGGGSGNSAKGPVEEQPPLPAGPGPTVTGPKPGSTGGNAIIHLPRNEPCPPGTREVTASDTPGIPPLPLAATDGLRPQPAGKTCVPLKVSDDGLWYSTSCSAVCRDPKPFTCPSGQTATDQWQHHSGRVGQYRWRCT